MRYKNSSTLCIDMVPVRDVYTQFGEVAKLCGLILSE